MSGPWQAVCGAESPLLRLFASADAAEVLQRLKECASDWAPGGWAWYTAADDGWHCVGQDGGNWPSRLPEALPLEAWPVGEMEAFPTGPQPARGYLLAKAAGLVPDVAHLAALKLGELLLHDQLSRAEAVQESVFRITMLAGTESDLRRFLAELHRELSRLLYAENFYVALYDAGLHAVRFPYYVDNHDELIPDPEAFEPIDLSDLSLTSWTLTHRRPLMLSKAEINAREAAGELRCVGEKPEFWMGVPLLGASDEPMGVASLQTYSPDRVYDETDRQLFLVVAQHIALGLERLMHRQRLESEVARRTEELTQLNARLQEEVGERERAERLQSALYQIAELSARPGEMDAFYTRLHEILGRLVYAKNCYIALYDPVEDMVSFPYYKDERVPSSPARKSRRGLTEYVIRTHMPVLLDQDGSKHLLEEGEVEFTSIGGGENTASWLGVPLFDGNDVCGMFTVQSYDPAVRYSQRDVDLMTFVSRHIGTALARKRAADALQQAYQELERRVSERTRELDEVNARLQFDNLHDALTHLPNRTYFTERLQQAWQGLSQRGERFALLFVDLDRFKHINDSLGHQQGDALLIEAGERLLDCLRSADFLARLGGDEFAILIPGGTVRIGERVAQRIVEAFDQPVQLAGRAVFTSCSIGVVLSDRQHHHSPEDMLRDADVAMYQAKARGRDCYVIYNRTLRQKVSSMVEQESALRRALKRDDELLPFVQPIVSGPDGRIVALEVLVRWQTPQGWLVPAQFLGLAENSRLIARLDLYMLEWVCGWLAKADASVPPLHLNCSSVSFVRPEWASDVLGALDRCGVASSRLQIELTESALLADPVQASKTLAALRDGGVKVVLDDFGTGYASLSYLHQYPFDALKIDKTFILDLETQPRSEAIVRSVLLLAESLGLEVVAEGVETSVVLEKLAAMGHMQMQGYLFARPFPLSELDLPTLQREIAAKWGGRAAG